LKKEDKDRLLDSVRIVKVIDRRPTKDSIIGFARTGSFDKRVPLIIDRPLTGYLKESFNSMISKNPDATGSVGVTIYVDKFESGINESVFSNNIYHRYSYLFDFPIDSNRTRSVRIIDSLSLKSTSFDNDRISWVIKDGIKKSSREFIDYYKENKYSLSYPYISSTATPGESNTSNGALIDSINHPKKQEGKSKAGMNFSYYRGSNIDVGFRAEYLQMSLKDSSRLEMGIGSGLTVFSVKPNEKYSSGTYWESNSGLLFRYNMSDSINTAFIGGGFKLSAGTETIKGYAGTGDMHIFFGPTFEEFVGIYLFKPIAISIGSYQLMMWDSLYH
jgi:hypothetical protein